MQAIIFPCREAHAEAVLVYGADAQQPIVATVMEEIDNFTCAPQSSKLIRGGDGFFKVGGLTVE